jgi:hypothetical protein
MPAAAMNASPLTTLREEQILLPGQTPAGEYILSVLVKRTYAIRPGQACVRLPVAAKLVKGDKHYGDPRITPVQFESDLLPFKLATDIVVIGKACAPGGQPALELLCAVQAGQVRKEVLVTGDRTCIFQGNTSPRFTEPEPFLEMPVTYDRAYGGVDIRSEPGTSYPYPKNPLGRGFVVSNIREAVDGLALPNIEDPQQRLTPAGIITGQYPRWEHQLMPQGLGWYSKCLYPRALLAGVMPADRPFEEMMRKEYEKAVPEEQREMYRQTRLPDMDFRFFNGASPGLVVPYMNGDEDVALERLAPEERLSFRLAGERPRIEIDIGFGVYSPEVVMHTLTIRSDDRQLDLVWRGCVAYPGPDWLPEMKKLDICIT